MAKKLKEFEVKIVKYDGILTLDEYNKYKYKYNLYYEERSNITFLSNDYIFDKNNMGTWSFRAEDITHQIDIKNEIIERLNTAGYKMNDIFNETNTLYGVDITSIRNILLNKLVYSTNKAEKDFKLFSKTKYFKDLEFINEFIIKRSKLYHERHTDTIYQGYKKSFEAFIDKSIKKDPSTYKKYEYFLTDKLKKKWKHLGGDFGLFDENLKHIIPYGLSINK